jgi:hypothetical protein
MVFRVVGCTQEARINGFAFLLIVAAFYNSPMGLQDYVHREPFGGALVFQKINHLLLYQLSSQSFHK